MFIHVSSRTETTTGPHIPFTCPKCEEQVSGDVLEAVERGKLYGVLPVTSSRSTYVTCPACRRKFGLALRLEKLQALPPEAIAALILPGPPKAAMWLAIAGVVLMLVPLVGMVLSGISLFLGRGTGGWVRALGWMGFIVNLALTGCMVALAFIH